MTTETHRRLLLDLRKMQQDPPFGTSAAPVGDDILKWEAVIFGPADTEWEGIFTLTLEFPNNYPTRPPLVKFKSRVFHPNGTSKAPLYIFSVYRRLNLFGHFTKRVEPSLRRLCHPHFNSGLYFNKSSIQSLLGDPNIQSPANNEAASLYINDRAEYSRRVRSAVAESLLVAREQLSG
ncbi:bifunctional Ubiquitin-conjugating enzyme E2/Ubiquitin-conjugating enzyme-RWD-like [Babesia duncani]|uniref:Bifunctional Ubiquitin-conjugating enzyme E2/Ubiquitin-conjugating enzyme-RWD-like n=1 Tax=Babesia duncani TaxID=323732 RepID=A0AAD9PHF0_9APIC|nr:bifunctional Ubiquitin-conjugating enzyme E2/Ubiquitin-conjugating enzyme-RWD-like [Babesia duncani]